MSKTITSGKLQTINKKLSFSFYSIVNDKEGIFFQNFLEIFKNVSTLLKQDSDIDIKYLRSIALIKYGLRAYKDMMMEVLATPEVAKKLGEIDTSKVFIEKISDEEAELVAILLLSGEHTLIITISEYIKGIAEHVFQNRISELLGVVSDLVITSLNYYTINSQILPRYDVQSENFTAKAYTSSPVLQDKIRTTIEHFMVIEIGETPNSDSL